MSQKLDFLKRIFAQCFFVVVVVFCFVFLQGGGKRDRETQTQTEGGRQTDRQRKGQREQSLPKQ